VIILVLEEGLDEVWCIWNQLFGMLEDRGNGKDGILADVCMTMF